MEFYTRRTKYEEIIIETNSVGVWMEWAKFDVHNCKFEMEQRLNARDIDLAAYRQLVRQLKGTSEGRSGYYTGDREAVGGEVYIEKN